MKKAFSDAAVDVRFVKGIKLKKVE